MSGEKGYDVIRFIEHGGKCRPAMDYVRGQVLIERIRGGKKVPKELLFQWFRMLCSQMDCYHRSKRAQCYRYLSPYSVVVTKEEQLFLLDLGAASNAFVMKKMQLPAVREHFVMPKGKKRRNMAIGMDLYGLGKLFQFLLASTETVPKLSWREEMWMTLVIQKCTGENGKKPYEEFEQVLKRLPYTVKVGNPLQKIKKSL